MIIPIYLRDFFEIVANFNPATVTFVYSFCALIMLKQFCEENDHFKFTREKLLSPHFWIFCFLSLYGGSFTADLLLGQPVNLVASDKLLLFGLISISTVVLFPFDLLFSFGCIPLITIVRAAVTKISCVLTICGVITKSFKIVGNPIVAPFLGVIGGVGGGEWKILLLKLYYLFSNKKDNHVIYKSTLLNINFDLFVIFFCSFSYFFVSINPKLVGYQNIYRGMLIVFNVTHTVLRMSYSLIKSEKVVQNEEDKEKME
eukprot:TRINITY_DN836_c0_g1_i1.p1 TRINITY_DN836_c0_g1~~TRINITY_DN836_c0_g1_i1.p1  ORF type:complete len:258 (-),score=56.19 TRINITY_DN836_c0_g1_i1:29-802(-)